MFCSDPCQPNPAEVLNPASMPVVCNPCASGGGGGSSAVQHIDTFSIAISGDGSNNTPLQASIIIDPAIAGNMLVEGPGGLSVGREVPNGGLMGQVLGKTSNVDQEYAWIDAPGGGGGGTIATADTPTIDFGGNGASGTPLTAQVKRSADAGNGLEERADGLWVAPGTPGAQGEPGPRGDSVVPNEWGILTDAKIAAIQTADVDWVFSVQATNGPTAGDQRANQSIPAGISGDMQSHLVRYDASDNLWQDLGPFAGVPGAPGTPGAAGPGVAAGGTSGQILAKASGTDYATQWIDPPSQSVSVAASQSILLSGVGTVGSPLVATAKIDPAAGNSLASTANGLFVAREIPAGGTNQQVLRKVGTTDYDVAWGDEVSGLTSVATGNTNSATITGNGQGGSPISVAVKRNTATHNLITEDANGLMVSGLMSIDTKTGTAVTAALGDNLKYINFTATTAKSYTIPTNATAAFPIGSTMSVFNEGTTDLTFAAAGGVTIVYPTDQTLVLATGKAASLVKVDVNKWHLSGGMKAA